MSPSVWESSGERLRVQFRKRAPRSEKSHVLGSLVSNDLSSRSTSSPPVLFTEPGGHYVRRMLNLSPLGQKIGVSIAGAWVITSGPASVRTKVSSALAPVMEGFQAKACPARISCAVAWVAMISREAYPVMPP
jgi:hypothetical protein